MAACRVAATEAQGGQASAARPLPVARMLGSPATWAIILANIANHWGWGRRLRRCAVERGPDLRAGSCLAGSLQTCSAQ